VKELGLSLRFEDITPHPLESGTPDAVLLRRVPEAVEKRDEENQGPRCIKCYSADVTCHEGEKPLSYAGANPFDPSIVTLHVRNCTCNSCGYEWDDEDTP